MTLWTRERWHARAQCALRHVSIIALTLFLVGLAIGASRLAEHVFHVRILTWTQAPQDPVDWFVGQALSGLVCLFAACYAVACGWSLALLVQAAAHAPPDPPSLCEALYSAENPSALGYRIPPGEPVDAWRYFDANGYAVRLPLALFQMGTCVVLFMAVFLLLARCTVPMGGLLGMATARIARLNTPNCTAWATYGEVAQQCWDTPEQCPCAQLGSVPVILVYIILCCTIALCGQCCQCDKQEEEEEEEEAEEVVEGYDV